MDKNDSHISKPDANAQPPGPTRQRHRNARGENVTGMTNPNGAAPDTSNKMAGQSKNY